MNFACARTADIPQPLYRSLAQYRYQVFVERLGWELPSEPGHEQDQFDHPATVHVMARDAAGRFIGCGRLLPTTGPYLLESVFPHLLNGLPVPRSEKVWELSRFAAMDPNGPSHGRDHMAERVLLQALRFCAGHGVTHLLAVSTPPVERLLLRAGVQCQRLGPPDMAGGKPVIAFVIAVTDVSIAALARIEAAALRNETPVRAPRSDGTDVLQGLLVLAHDGMDGAAPVPAGTPAGAVETTLH
ncbi:acyl-homoserine-lactone synthase [Pseudorhodoferax sp.]|uniref:acyl-homoserine-lactone synthase n=1 Tax=Pseudorhodoferax sp. TaxID=1993553 RepID=UPI002DD66748|nr:acyl-homoserine-lactone synthase [Pseudorhodoferax sp.]